MAGTLHKGVLLKCLSRDGGKLTCTVLRGGRSRKAPSPLGTPTTRGVLKTRKVRMPLAPFYSKFRDLAFEETRTVFLRNHESLPDGTYGFLEFYCNEVGCDCRRVLVQVIRPETGSRVWALINFGWETPAFYRRWTSANPDDADEMATATLDPINPQSRYSNALLRLFSDIVIRDAAYVQRL